MKKEKGKKTHQETYLALIQINSFLDDRPTTAKLSTEKKKRGGSLGTLKQESAGALFRPFLFCSNNRLLTVNTFHLRHTHTVTSVEMSAAAASTGANRTNKQLTDVHNSEKL